jgi:hypothetical protein
MCIQLRVEELVIMVKVARMQPDERVSQLPVSELVDDKDGRD